MPIIYLDKIHALKILCCVILTVSHLGAITAKLVIKTWYWFQLVADIRDSVCWVLSFSLHSPIFLFSS